MTNTDKPQIPNTSQNTHNQVIIAVTKTENEGHSEHQSSTSFRPNLDSSMVSSDFEKQRACTYSPSLQMSAHACCYQARLPQSPPFIEHFAVNSDSVNKPYKKCEATFAFYVTWRVWIISVVMKVEDMTILQVQSSQNSFGTAESNSSLLWFAL